MLVVCDCQFLGVLLMHSNLDWNQWYIGQGQTPMGRGQPLRLMEAGRMRMGRGCGMAGGIPLCGMAGGIPLCGMAGAVFGCGIPLSREGETATRPGTRRRRGGSVV